MPGLRIQRARALLPAALNPKPQCDRSFAPLDLHRTAAEERFWAGSLALQ